LVRVGSATVSFDLNSSSVILRFLFKNNTNLTLLKTNETIINMSNTPQTDALEDFWSGDPSATGYKDELEKLCKKLEIELRHDQIESKRNGLLSECKTRIQHLNMEKDRLKSSYLRNCAEINAHIKNCERTIKDNS